ncbi:MAG: phosphoglycerate dehydrogenase [Phycisphaerales bacterium]
MTTATTPMPDVTSFPRHKIKVVLFENVHPRAEELLSARGYDIERVNGSLSGDELVDAAGDAHMVGIRSKTHLTADFFERTRHLWAVGCFCIGTNQVDLEAAAARGVCVFNAPFSNTRSVAEKTICEIIALHRRLFDRSRAMHEGRWEKSAKGSHEIRGKTLGIVGYGRIGSQLSVLAEAMGMRVLYHDIVDTLPLGNAIQCSSLQSLMEQSDVVSLHVPATSSTQEMIGARELAWMKPGAFLINNARGSVIDLPALERALTEGHLGGAAIDVFPEEPANNEAQFHPPLQGLPNVILTPHIGGSTAEAQRNIAEEVGQKLITLMDNGSTTTSVNLPEVQLPVLHEDHRRVLHIHQNVPGVLAKLHTIASELGMNIAAQHLQSDPARSYVIFDVKASPADTQALCDRLKKEMSETIRARTIF